MNKTTYTPEAAELILEGLSIGWPLATMCMAFNGRNGPALERFSNQCPDLVAEIKGLGFFPRQRTVYEWMDAHEDFKAAVLRVREMGEETLMSETLDIADAVPVFSPNGGIDSADVANRKLRIWAREQLARRFNPRRWGDKVDVNHSGEVKVTRVSFSDGNHHP